MVFPILVVPVSRLAIILLIVSIPANKLGKLNQRSSLVEEGRTQQGTTSAVKGGGKKNKKRTDTVWAWWISVDMLDPREDAQEYMEKHGISKLFQVKITHSINRIPKSFAKDAHAHSSFDANPTS